MVTFGAHVALGNEGTCGICAQSCAWYQGDFLPPACFPSSVWLPGALRWPWSGDGVELNLFGRGKGEGAQSHGAAQDTWHGIGHMVQHKTNDMAWHGAHGTSWDMWYRTHNIGTRHMVWHGTHGKGHMAWGTWHSTGHMEWHRMEHMAYHGTHGTGHTTLAQDTWRGMDTHSQHAHMSWHGRHGMAWDTWQETHGMGHMAQATHPQHWAATSLKKAGGIWDHYQPNKPKALGITLRILFSLSHFFQLFHPLNCFSPSEICPEISLNLHGRAGGCALLLLSRATQRCHNGKLSC